MRSINFRKNWLFLIIGGMFILMMFVMVVGKENRRVGDIRGVEDYPTSSSSESSGSSVPCEGACCDNPQDCADPLCHGDPCCGDPCCGSYCCRTGGGPNCHDSPCTGGAGCSSGNSCDSTTGICSPRCSGGSATQADCSDCGGTTTGYSCDGTSTAGGGCSPNPGTCCSWCGNCAPAIPTVFNPPITEIPPTEAGQGGGVNPPTSGPTGTGTGGGVTPPTSSSSSSSDSSGCIGGGSPAKTTISPPNGTFANPIILPGPAVTLSWSQNLSSLTDGYNVQVLDSTGSAVWSTIVSGISNLTVHTTSLTIGEFYHWRVRAINTDCGTVFGPWSDYDYFVLDRPPTFVDLKIKNSAGVSVPVESNNSNQICAKSFMNNEVHDRRAIFSVTIADPRNGDSIKKVSLKFSKGGVDYLTANFDNGVSSLDGNGASFWGDGVTTSISGNNRIVNFPIEFNETFNTNTYDMMTYAKDSNNNEMTGIWVDTTRDFRVWNCLVPISGSIYAGDNTISCSSNLGYTNKIPSTYGFGLSYLFGELAPRNMTVNSPEYSSDSENKLIWGTNYTALFANFNGNVSDQIKITNLGTGATTCVSNSDLSLNVDNYISAYSDNPAIKVDFSSILNQDAWYQVSGGGINSETRVIDNVPKTCAFTPLTCTSSMTVNNLGIGTSNNGLVSATQIKNNSGCDDCKYGASRNWSVTKDIVGESYTYKYFYDRYFVNLGQGQVVDSWSKIKGKTGVFFVNGDLNIDTDNTVAPGSFLMVIASRSINISGSVNKIEGIFIADGSIIAKDESDTQLTIDGMLYSNNSNVVLSRSYADKSLNNSKPSVVVNYRPDLVFSLPGKLVKILSGWKEGI